MSNVVLNKNQNEELVKITRNEKGIEVVSTRELYSKLKIERDFTTWFKKMVSYGFEEGKDFTPVRVESTGGRPSVDYGITLDMAMHISMIQRTDEGKELRQYFIDYVKKNESNQPVQHQLPQTFAEALLLAGKIEEERVKALAMAEEVQKQLAEVNEVAKEQAEQLTVATGKINVATKTIEEYQPQVDYAKAVKDTGESCLVSHLANIITQSTPYAVGQNRLYEFLRETGFLGTSGERKNKPYQQFIERGWFELKYTEYNDLKTGKTKYNTVTKVTPKGQEKIIDIFVKAQEL